MTADELRNTLKNLNKYSDNEIDQKVERFLKSQNDRKAMIIANKSYKAKIAEIIKEYDQKNIRLFRVATMGICVIKDGDKANVSFSFLNPNDIAINDESIITDDRGFKYHALLNMKLGVYTYTVDWKGRSEFAIYDAYAANHKKFPGSYKNLSMDIGFTIYKDSDSIFAPIHQ